MKGKVLQNSRIAAGVHKMILLAEGMEDSVPGQFVNMYPKEGSMLLPRPISICGRKGKELTLVYRVSGKGTAEFAGYRPEEEVRLLGPLGNGFTLLDDYQGAAVAVVGGGVGIPPLVGLAEALKERGARVHAFLGFAQQAYLTEEMQAAADDVSVATEDGSLGFCGNVVELLNRSKAEASVIFACGPKPMLRALAGYAETEKIALQVSLEERMGCGYGACVGCTCKTKDGENTAQKRVCKDGPVFSGKAVVWE